MEVQDWGLIDYVEALQKQEELVDEVATQKKSGILVFCSHPPIITLGRKTQAGDVFNWSGPVKEISRGGRATYHGPSQLVIYPIYNLDFPRVSKPRRDIGWYLRTLENAILQTLQFYGVNAQGKSLQKKNQSENETEETGVWVGAQKIASLGIAVRKWVAYHGAAINLDEDPLAFQGMKPCGFHSSVMISLEKILGRKINTSEFKNELSKNLNFQLD